MIELKKLFYQLIAGKGIKIATDKLYKKRISICRSNKCGVYKKPFKLRLMEKCGDCGCLLRSKCRIDEFYIECPRGFW